MLKKSQINLNTYVYAGTDQYGNKIKGECRGKTKNAALLQLKSKNITIEKIQKKTDGLFTSKKIKEKDILNFTRYLATMIKSGVPIIQSLEVCIRAATNTKLVEMLSKIKTAVETGHSFSDALNLYPEHFSHFYRNLLKIGENSGKLDIMLVRVADYLEKMSKLKDKFKKAMMYPVIILSVSIGVTAILLIYVVPQFESMFANLNAELPWFTQKVLNISRWLQEYWFRLFTASVTIWYVLSKYFKKSQKAKQFVDGLILKAPIFGPLIEKICLARFARTLTTMLSSGIPLLNCLPAAGRIIDNSVYSIAIKNIKTQVENGLSLNKAMQNTDCFNHMVIQMIAIGENSGSLDEMLLKIAELYENEVDDTVSNLSTILEPIIILLISGIVGSLIIAMYLPIFSLGSVL